jgi:hypothetical protein
MYKYIQHHYINGEEKQDMLMDGAQKYGLALATDKLINTADKHVSYQSWYKQQGEWNS